MFLPIGSNIPNLRIPWATLTWILLCITTFVGITQFEVSLEYTQTKTFLASVVPSESNTWWKYFTYQFFHSSWGHLVSNIWYLAIFGWVLESFLGPTRFMIFSLIGGALAVFPEKIFQFNPTMPVVGASGSVAFMMGAVALLYPTSRIRFLFTPLPIPPLPSTLFIPLRYLIYFWLLLQVSGLAMNFWVSHSPVAYATHLTGFAVGMLASLAFRRSVDSKFMDVELMGKDLQNFYVALQNLTENRAEEARVLLADLAVKHPYRTQLQEKIFQVAVEFDQKDLADMSWRRVVPERLILRQGRELERLLNVYLAKFSELPPIQIQERVKIGQLLKGSHQKDLQLKLQLSVDQAKNSL